MALHQTGSVLARRREAYLARGIGLFTLDPTKHLPEALLELLVLGAGVELADEVAASLKGVTREAKGRGAEVLQVTQARLTFSVGATYADECAARG